MLSIIIVLQKLSFCIYIDRLKSFFFLNDAGNPKPVSMKFYTVMQTQTGCFPGNLVTLVKNGQNGPQKTFCKGDNASEMSFLSVHFLEIWKQFVSLCRHHSFRNRTANFFSLRGHLLPKPTF